MASKAGFRSYPTAFVVAVLLATFVRTFLFQPFRVSSGSMEPGILAGDFLLINKFIYGAERLGGARHLLPMAEVGRGDVAVFSSPEAPHPSLIKRCLGLTGEIIEIDPDGLKIGSSTIDEGGYLSAAASTAKTLEPTSIPPDHVFCLGDSRDRSVDSRAFGAIPEKLLVGQAFLIWWSVEPLEQAPERAGFWGMIDSGLRNYSRWLLHSRWRRSFSPVR